MKICIATSSFPAQPDDSLRAPFLLEAIAALRARRHEIHVLTQGPEARHGFDFPVTAFAWPGSAEGAASGLLARPVRNGGRIVSLLASGALALRRLHARERFDAVLCCWAVPAGTWAKLAGVPYVVWCLGTDVNSLKGKRVGRLALKSILGGARARFADGFALREDVAAISGLPCEFLPTFRRLTFTESPLSTDAPGEVGLLYVGRHEKVKGTDLLLEAFAVIATAYPNARLRIAGDGSLTAGLRRFAEARGWFSIGKVEFLGRVPEAELPSLYARASAIVIPSRSESIPLVLGEAAQADRPVVVTDVGDMGKLAREYRLGAVATEPTASAIADALRTHLSGRNPTDSRRRDFLELLSFEKHVPRLLEALGPRP